MNLIKGGREVCLVYSDYDEQSSETSVEVDQIFCEQKTDGLSNKLFHILAIRLEPEGDDFNCQSLSSDQYKTFPACAISLIYGEN